VRRPVVGVAWVLDSAWREGVGLVE
jgi:hypothetical protein